MSESLQTITTLERWPHRKVVLFVFLAMFFIGNALIAEFIGVKIFTVEGTLGLKPFQFNFFGADTLSLNMTAGVVLWPIVFIMTDIINEYFGLKGVRWLSYITAGVIAYAFFVVFFSIRLEPAGFWIEKKTASGTLNMQDAFAGIFGQGQWIIIGSLVAFLLGQIVDVWVFHRVKRLTGEKSIWLRSTGSTLVSQLIDSFVVIFIAFYIGGNFSLNLVLSIALVNYLFKSAAAIVLTPALYGVHIAIEKYLGHTLAERMRSDALAGRDL